jgi:hemolysin III
LRVSNKYKKIFLTTYLGIGFISLSILGELYEKLLEQAIDLLALGGLIYSLEVFFYVKKRCPTLTLSGTFLF